MKNQDINLTYKLLEEYSKSNQRMFKIIIFLILVIIAQFAIPYIADRQEVSQTIQDVSNSEVKNEVK